MNLATRIEKWASGSPFRVLGAPALAALLLTGLVTLVAGLHAAASMFANGFFLFIILSVLNALTGVPRIRLALQMIFMVFFFGCLITLPLYIYFNPGVLQ